MKVNETYNTVDVPMSEIYSDEEFNCRGHLAPMDVMDLVPDIKARGLDQPITIRPYDAKPGKKYRIVTGHRRFMAFRVLERDTIPCRIRTDLKPFDENILNLTENIKRKDLNMLQEARGILALEKAGWNEETIANRVGMSRGWVQVRLMLLRLPLDIQAEVGAGIINQTQVRQLYMLRDRKDEMYAIARKIKDLRASGESAKITIPKKPNPYRKELRTPTEMFDFQDIIQKVIGNNFATKCIGWCAGANNDYEIHRALLEEASKMGITYTIPQEILERF